MRRPNDYRLVIHGVEVGKAADARFAAAEFLELAARPRTVVCPCCNGRGPAHTRGGTRCPTCQGYGQIPA